MEIRDLAREAVLLRLGHERDVELIEAKTEIEELKKQVQALQRQIDELAPKPAEGGETKL